MHSTTEKLDDQTFLAQFENQTLSPEDFNHVGHVRLTWLVVGLSDGHVDTAVARVCEGILAYATSLGVRDMFHRTITETLVRVTAMRMDQLPAQHTWEMFQENNQDLFKDALNLLAQYYTKDLLFSDEARQSMIAPDRRPLSLA